MLSQSDWKKVEALFSESLALPREQRLDFLKQRCATLTTNADEIQQEVASLLNSHDEVESQTPTPNQSTEGSDRLRGSLGKLAARVSQESSDGYETVDDEASLDTIRQRLQMEADLEILEVLGRGGAGIVFRATQKSLDRNVAVKVLLNTAIDSAARKRFAAEAQATARVIHPNVVDIYSVSEVSPSDPADALTYLVMELVEGPTLKKALEQTRRVPAGAAAKIARHVAMGLEAAHQQGLVHRDVKPANIMFANAWDAQTSTRLLRPISADRWDTDVKLLDFGIVRDLSGDQYTQVDQVVGTPAYMSHEQLVAAEKVDARSDVYSLGVTLYEMLVGTRPFVGAPHMIVQQQENRIPESPRSLDDQIPKDLNSICMKAIRRQPDKRYQSAAEMAEDLDRFLSGQPTEARPVTQVERLMSWQRRNKRLASVIGLAALVSIMLVIGSIAFALVVDSKNREITKQRSIALESSVQGILDSEPGALLEKVETIRDQEQSALVQLSERRPPADARANRQVNHAVALSLLGRPQTDRLIGLLDQVQVAPAVCRNFEAALRADSDAVKRLSEAIGDQEKKMSDASRARQIILLAQLGEFDLWRQAAENKGNPSLRAAIVHQFADWHGNLENFVTAASKLPDAEWTWTICQALMELDPRSIRTPDADPLERYLKARYASKHYSVFRFADLALARLNAASESSWRWDHPKCKTFTGGIAMVHVPPGKTELGRFDPATTSDDYPPHPVELTKGYWIADAEVTIGQYREFAQQQVSAGEMDADWFEQYFGESVSNDLPARRVSWFDAVKFCNWLSRRHGLEEVYHRQEEDFIVVAGDGEELRFPDWRARPTANGFRLPTEAEWGYACRNDSKTRYHFGEDDSLVDQYSVASSGRNLEPLPVRHLRPNSRGLFGMFGNVWEWSYDRYANYEQHKALIDPKGLEDYKTGVFRNVVLGAGIATAAGNNDCESRGADAPASRFGNLGFRLAMNAE